MNKNRQEIAKRYLSEIKNEKIILPIVNKNNDHVWHIFAVRCEQRDELEKYLNEHGVGTNKHYPTPMHLQGAYADLKMKKGDLPIAEEISSHELSIPMYYGMSKEDVDYIIELLNNF